MPVALGRNVRYSDTKMFGVRPDADKEIFQASGAVFQGPKGLFLKQCLWPDRLLQAQEPALHMQRSVGVMEGCVVSITP